MKSTVFRGLFRDPSENNDANAAPSLVGAWCVLAALLKKVKPNSLIGGKKTAPYVMIRKQQNKLPIEPSKHPLITRPTRRRM